MKGQHPCPPQQKKPTDQLSAALTDAHDLPDRKAIYSGAPRQASEAPVAKTLAVISYSAPLLLPDGHSRRVREQKDRIRLEDKIRQTVDSWTAEEQATAYWYLYACGMTLERAKAIRQKNGSET